MMIWVAVPVGQSSAWQLKTCSVVLIDAEASESGWNGHRTEVQPRPSPKPSVTPFSASITGTIGYKGKSSPLELALFRLIFHLG
jgi:hypothetical protein